MKAVRASNRAPSKGPNSKDKATEVAQSRDQGHNDKITHPKAAKRRTEGRTSTASKKRKIQENWSLMPRSSIIALENILDLSVLAALAVRRTEKKESQEHLNTIKKRFLAQCAELKVPSQKQSSLQLSSQRLQEETKKAAAGKQTLRSLEEDLKAVVSALERTEEKIVALQHSCNMMRGELEEEEEKAKKIFEMMDQSVLGLPALPSQKGESTIESRLRAIIPDRDHNSIAQRLGEILQNPESTQDDQLLLLRAQKQADQLFNPLSSGASS
ncbi:centromere protein Q [Menidia menidia]